MPPDHPGAGVAHDGPDPLPHVGPVAVDGAVGASRLLRPEGTLVEALQGVGEKPFAILAESIRCAVAVPTEDPDHRLQGLSFPPDSGAGLSHEDSIMRPAADGKGFSDRGRPHRAEGVSVSVCDVEQDEDLVD